jgi:hypothetical protein
MILQDATGLAVFVNEVWNRKQRKEKECMIRRFHPEIDEKVCEA